MHYKPYLTFPKKHRLDILCDAYYIVARPSNIIIKMLYFYFDLSQMCLLVSTGTRPNIIEHSYSCKAGQGYAITNTISVSGSPLQHAGHPNRSSNTFKDLTASRMAQAQDSWSIIRVFTRYPK